MVFSLSNTSQTALRLITVTPPLSLLSGVSGESLVENTNRELFDSLDIDWSHKCPLSTSTRYIFTQWIYRQDQQSTPRPNINK